MNKLLFLFLTILVTLNSCKAQDTSNNNLKNSKNMEKTTEKFDSWTYYTQRQGSEYVFEDHLRGKVRQFGGDNGSDFVEYAKAHPDELTISNNGAGASNHIGAAHFAKEAGIQVTHVPFGGSTDMISALRGGHVNATVAKISEVASLVKSGELRLLASFTDKRLEGFEDVPTLTESGYPVIFGSARAIVAPKGTPKEIIQKLHDVLKAALESPDNIEKSKNASLPLLYMSPEELAQYIKDQETYIIETVPTLGIK